MKTVPCQLPHSIVATSTKLGRWSGAADVCLRPGLEVIWSRKDDEKQNKRDEMLNSVLRESLQETKTKK